MSEPHSITRPDIRCVHVAFVQTWGSTSQFASFDSTYLIMAAGSQHWKCTRSGAHCRLKSTCSTHRAIHGDRVQQVHVGAWRVPDDGARPAQAPIMAISAWTCNLQDRCSDAPPYVQVHYRVSEPFAWAERVWPSLLPAAQDLTGYFIGACTSGRVSSSASKRYTSPGSWKAPSFPDISRRRHPHPRTAGWTRSTWRRWQRGTQPSPACLGSSSTDYN